jgi:hypothetical protein
MTKKTYYIYWYRNPLKGGEIFYIGYGDHQRKCGGCRAYDHINEVKRGVVSSNKHKYYTIKQILDDGKEPIVEIISDSLTHSQAIEIEASLIEKHKSTLVNITEGGDGGDTFSGQPQWKKAVIRKKLCEKPPTIHSEKWIQKLSDDRKGSGNPFYGKHHSKRIKQICGAVWRGKKIPKELIEKRQRLSVYRVKTPTNVLKFIGRSELEKYFRELNTNKPKHQKINWQFLLRGISSKGYSVSMVGSIRKSEVDA